MNDTPVPQDTLAHASREEIMSALFANMVVQQTNLALMFLGRVPHPETGQNIRDMEAAKLFIDQLEMLEVKTKGNLDQREAALLKQSLTAVRMAFVEAVEPQTESPAAKTDATAPADGPAPASAAPNTPPAPAESHKKFTKKY